MKLTPELVAMVARVDDPPPLPPFTAPSDTDHDEAVRDVLASAPSSEEVWLFAYGSLLWNPAFDFVEQRLGVAPGWRRSFCLGWDRWFRGSARRPGLMLSLDHGGQCRGVVYRLPPDAVEANLRRVFRREIRAKPSAHSPRWVNVHTEKGPLRAISFVIDRKSERYVGGLSLEEVADALAAAAGPLGSMAEYLHNTVRHLEEAGLHDRQLWRLQELVGERIEAMVATDRSSEERTCLHQQKRSL